MFELWLPLWRWARRVVPQSGGGGGGGLALWGGPDRSAVQTRQVGCRACGGGGGICPAWLCDGGQAMERVLVGGGGGGLQSG